MPSCAVSLYICKCDNRTQKGEQSHPCPAPKSQENLNATRHGREHTVVLADHLSELRAKHPERPVFIEFRNREIDSDEAREEYATAFSLLVKLGLVNEKDLRDRVSKTKTFGVCGCHIAPEALSWGQARNYRFTWILDLKAPVVFLTPKKIADSQKVVGREHVFERAELSETAQKFKTSSDRWMELYLAEAKRNKELLATVKRQEKTIESHQMDNANLTQLTEALNHELLQNKEEELAALQLALQNLRQERDELLEALKGSSGELVHTLDSEQVKRLVQCTKRAVDDGEWDFLLTSVHRVCEEADAISEYEWIQSKLSKTVRAQLSLEEPSDKALCVSRKAAMHFLLSLELSGDKVSLVSNTLDMYNGKTKENMLRAFGWGKSVRQAQRNKVVILSEFDKALASRLEELCKKGDSFAWAILLADDDYTRSLSLSLSL